MTTRADYEARQQERITELRESTEDRPAHAAYLRALLSARPADDLFDVNIPPGVSARYARALIEDVDWCRTPLPAEVKDGDDTAMANLVHQWPAAYADRRRTDRAASRKRTRTQLGKAGLAGLLTLGPSAEE